ncbi:SKP1-like protein 14 [Mangifera indica]|uniref:SKP1-like protein 14 n=1 Tax=Mangifera indica TaxID=29780 RepID=UPI001CFADA68|nr:SKP1-like protein 14 [Mangifera indica]
MASNQVEEKVTTNQQKKITLKAEDGHLFEIEKVAAMECLGTVNNFFEDDANDADNVIVPIHNVSSAVLAQIIIYCNKHAGFREEEAEEPQKAEMRAFDDGFIKNQSVDMLKEILLAANYLNAKSLLTLTLDKFAERIKNKSVEYVREVFGIENDFTEEEEEKIRKENAWAFEGVDKD